MMEVSKEASRVRVGGTGARPGKPGMTPVDETRLDWKHYVDHRPPYPASLWETWTSYHRGPLSCIHDLGTGSGNAAEGLLLHVSPPPRVMVLTDPREQNILDARQRFTRAREKNAPPFSTTTRFVYRVARAEQPWDDISTAVESAKIDMVTACESLHWTVVDATLRNAAACLRADGTFAAVLYAPFPVIANRGGERARGTFDAFIRDHLADLRRQEWPNENWQRAGRQLVEGLDAVRLPGDVWKDVKRIDIHCKGGWMAATQEAGDRRDGGSAAGTRVEDLDSTVERVCVDDSGHWRRRASLEWVKGMLESLRFGFTADSWLTPGWLKFEDAVAGLGYTKLELELEWQVQMLLARRK